MTSTSSKPTRGLSVADATRHLQDAHRRGVPIRVAWAGQRSWAGAVRGLLLAGEVEAVRHALPDLRSQFASSFFAAMCERLRIPDDPDLPPAFGIAEASEYLRGAARKREPIETHLGKASTWAVALHRLHVSREHAAVAHALPALKAAFPKTGYFQTVAVEPAGQSDAVADVIAHLRSRPANAPADASLAKHPVWATAINHLVTAGEFGLARKALGSVRTAFPRKEYFRTMDAVLGRLPESDGQSFVDDRNRECQVVPCEGADTVVFAFTGAAQQLLLPVSVVHRWLRTLGVHIVYLREPQPRLFMRGVPALANSYDGTLDALRNIARDLQAPHMVTVGMSLGGYPALRYGIDLGVERSLAYSPMTHVETGRVEVLLRAAAARGLPDATLEEAAALDLRQRLAASARPPAFHIVYGEANEADRIQALHLDGMPDVTLEALPGVAGHNSLSPSVQEGRFEDQLRWLVPSAASGRLRPTRCA